MKYFRMSYEEVVFKRSYGNIMLLNKAIPSYRSYKDYNDDNENLDTEDDYIAAMRKAKKKTEKKEPKKVLTKPKTQHANDFFSQFM